MLEEFIIKDLRETEESFFVAGSDGKETEILKKDLGPIDLAVGNLITVIKHRGTECFISRAKKSQTIGAKTGKRGYWADCRIVPSIY